MTRNKGLLLALVLGCAAALGACYYQKQLLARYHCWRLSSADQAHLPGYVVKLEALGITGTQALLANLESSKETCCINSGEVLTKILLVWGERDPRYLTTLTALGQRSYQFSPVGTLQAMQLLRELTQGGAMSPGMKAVMAQWLQHTPASSEGRQLQLEWMSQLLEQESNQNEGLITLMRARVRTALNDSLPGVRLAAIKLAVTPALQLHESLAALVAVNHPDSSPEVRQLVLLALGGQERLLTVDMCCHYLHDSDSQVRRVAERVLKVRGWNEQQIHLARVMRDVNPQVRAEAPSLALQASEQEMYQALELLSSDPEPAVRAAAARAIAQAKDERLDVMMKRLVERDRDPSVQQIARYYLQQ